MPLRRKKFRPKAEPGVRAVGSVGAAFSDMLGDRLLIATGSTPFILPVPGKDLRGVISYRDIRDTEAMIDAATRYRHAVVIGGGLLGLEAANGLLRQGMDVSVVHVMDSLMERQLDKPAAKLLKTALEKRGMRFLLEANTAEICGSERVTSVKFKDGSEIAFTQSALVLENLIGQMLTSFTQKEPKAAPAAETAPKAEAPAAAPAK